MGRSLLATVVAASGLLAVASPAAAQAELEGITWSVLDGGPNGPDLISGATELAVAPPPGTPRCGALDPSFPVNGQITVQDNTAGGGDSADGSGTVPAFGGGTGAPFSFSANSGPLGENPTGTFDLGFPTGRESRGEITCLQVVGSIAYLAGRRMAQGPITKEDCKEGDVPPPFKNQGDCVSFVGTGGKNPPKPK